MKSKHEFYNDYIFMVKQHIRALNDKKEKIDDIDRKIEYGIYDNSKLNNQKKTIKKEMSDLQAQYADEIKTLCSDYVRELNNADVLKGEELTDDVKLLESNINLSEKNIQMMVERNKGNNTMQKVINQYAREHDVNVGVYINPYQESIQAVNNLPYTAEVVERWFDKMSVFDELLGDNSATTKLFTSE